MVAFHLELTQQQLDTCEWLVQDFDLGCHQQVGHVCLSLYTLIQTLIKNLKHSPLFKKNKSRWLHSLGRGMFALSALLFTKWLNMFLLVSVD